MLACYGIPCSFTKIFNIHKTHLKHINLHDYYMVLCAERRVSWGTEFGQFLYNERPEDGLKPRPKHVANSDHLYFNILLCLTEPIDLLSSNCFFRATFLLPTL